VLDEHRRDRVPLPRAYGDPAAADRRQLARDGRQHRNQIVMLTLRWAEKNLRRWDGLQPLAPTYPDGRTRVKTLAPSVRFSSWTPYNPKSALAGPRMLNRMSRLPFIHEHELDESSRQTWDSITGTRGSGAVNDAGEMVGPFNAWLYAPRLGTQLSEVGAVLRFQASIERRLLELAIITVAAHWRAEFEWFAHARFAQNEGVTVEVIDAIRIGTTPTFSRDDERVVHAAARQLVTRGVLDEEIYGEVFALFGAEGTVELVSLCGYYSMVSFTLNTFQVELPAGVSPQWPQHEGDTD
jgi:4-carboxymuconolactone decarboxylase